MLCRRLLRCLCICCCRCCCVKPAPYPEEILGTTRQAIIKAIIVLLSLGVCACCAYGMSQIDPQLVSKGLSVINNLKVCCSFASENLSYHLIEAWIVSGTGQVCCRQHVHWWHFAICISILSQATQLQGPT